MPIDGEVSEGMKCTRCESRFYWFEHLYYLHVLDLKEKKNGKIDRKEVTDLESCNDGDDDWYSSDVAILAVLNDGQQNHLKKTSATESPRTRNLDINSICSRQHQIKRVDLFQRLKRLGLPLDTPERYNHIRHIL